MALEFVSEILLPRLLAASVQSTLFVVVVWTLCKSLPRLSASARAGLWWLVALQLVVGVLWSSPLALPLLPAEVMEQASAAPAPMTVLSLAPAETLASPMTSASPYLASSAASSWSWSGALAWLWLLGLSFMVARTLHGYMATRRLLRDSRACKDRTLLHALQLAAEAHGLRRTPHLRLSASIDSPQLIGPWRPVLLLPADHPQSMHADELDMALTHELVHLQRHDLWWGLLPAVAQHLFFFHPLAHLAAREYALAREVACDAAVLAGNRHCARDYGRLLIRLGVAPRPSAGLASASPTFHILKRRLLMLQNTASTPRVVALAILGVVAVLGVMPYRIIAAPAPAAETATAPRAPVATTPKPSAAPVAAPAPRVAATPVPAPTPVAAETPEISPAAEIAPPRPIPAPPAPPAPVSAPTPAALPAPPAPPAPPAAARITRGTFHLATNANEAYVLLREDNSVMNGSMEDLREAQRLQRNGEELLWFRRGESRYVIRDPATLERFRATYAEVMRLGDAQSTMGNRQSAIGDKQAAIGSRQAELGMKQAELATRRMRENEADARMAELDRQQAALERQQAELAAPMAELDREQAALDKRMKAADARAERDAKNLMYEAIIKGMAQPLKKG
ncbi:M56 family metallopeptidase [Pseudoxanthomonas sacheonensis]|uniref:Beta-lactamase regulating signal transducer with metallopeptidase domain n=1 Tax=Pseudoxanthomonas sacheonensis TaxID=443615 RepID=A0ABU1RTM6_9GAMM|nr:M56 family metallopeptidase [Pseudoxanthomonas sacheonensis]MDR6841474.1 beta-lactamase regulating signal transducer with metallopeptidase domain [Pseudoxanthomonas sacheonensis]